MNEHKPGDNHEYEMRCKVCGQFGTVQLNLVPQTSEPTALHVYPVGTGHDIDHGLNCWCRPYRDGREPSIIIHRPDNPA